MFCNTQIKDRICILTIEKEDTLNSLNTSLLIELNECIQKIEENDGVDVLIITGKGKSFVAGADIKEMSHLNQNEAIEFSKLGSSVFRKIELLNKVVIAAVNGYAIGGGCELALACDIRIASDNATFSQPESILGITPGFSGTQRLPRVVGMGIAKEMIFSGKFLSADEAYRVLLVNKVVEKDTLLDYCLAIASKITKRSSIAIEYSKKAINLGIEENIEKGIEIETELFSKSFSHIDQKEGMNAFLEKRTPQFKKNNEQH